MKCNINFDSQICRMKLLLILIIIIIFEYECELSNEI